MSSFFGLPDAGMCFATLANGWGQAQIAIVLFAPVASHNAGFMNDRQWAYGAITLLPFSTGSADGPSQSAH